MNNQHMMVTFKQLIFINLHLSVLCQPFKDSGDLAEEQVEKNPTWSQNSWRNRVKQYLERRREEGFRLASREKSFEQGRNIPSTFLSPPGGDIQFEEDDWTNTFESRTENLDIELTTSETITANLFENLANTTLDILNDIDEVRELSVQAKTTLAKLKEFKNATVATKCQSAEDCKSNQVCYLPTNECKDQLTFSLRQTSSCQNSTMCGNNQVCYNKECVCALGYIEKSSECVALKSLNCTETFNSSKIVDTSFWGVQPFCVAWGNNTVFGGANGKLLYGNYESGSGSEDDPMMFTGGSSANCGKSRSAELIYECFCDEYPKDCETKTPVWNTTTLWWGEFRPCHYSAYVFSPLACTSLIQ